MVCMGPTDLRTTEDLVCKNIFDTLIDFFSSKIYKEKQLPVCPV